MQGSGKFVDLLRNLNIPTCFISLRNKIDILAILSAISREVIIAGISLEQYARLNPK
jgi:hypothetical protein